MEVMHSAFIEEADARIVLRRPQVLCHVERNWKRPAAPNYLWNTLYFYHKVEASKLFDGPLIGKTDASDDEYLFHVNDHTRNFPERTSTGKILHDGLNLFGIFQGDRLATAGTSIIVLLRRISCRHEARKKAGSTNSVRFFSKDYHIGNDDIYNILVLHSTYSEQLRPVERMKGRLWVCIRSNVKDGCFCLLCHAQNSAQFPRCILPMSTLYFSIETVLWTTWRVLNDCPFFWFVEAVPPFRIPCRIDKTEERQQCFGRPHAGI